MILHTAALVATLLTADRTEPIAYFAAEATVVSVRPQAPENANDVVWDEVTFNVKRCTGGTCRPRESLKILIANAVWKNETGDVMGIVQYGWMDDTGKARTWSRAFNLNEDFGREQFDKDTAVASSDRPERSPAIQNLKSSSMRGQGDTAAAEEAKKAVAER